MINNYPFSNKCLGLNKANYISSVILNRCQGKHRAFFLVESHEKYVVKVESNRAWLHGLMRLMVQYSEHFCAFGF